MDINPFWQEDVFLTVQDIDHNANIKCAKPHFVIDCNRKFYLHLVPLDNTFKPEDLLKLQLDYQKEGLQLVHLWEDVWLARRNQVLSRIKSFLGLNQSFHGRKAKITIVAKEDSINFLDKNHLQGYIRAKYSFGLIADQELIALASFSDTRPMKSKGPAYVSAELVRFASKDGLTIVGGLSKLIKHFLKEIKVNDLMTYADRDWSLGKGYETLGFELTSVTEPAKLYLDQKSLIRYFPHRLSKSILLAFESQNILNLDDYLVANGFVKLFNTGNLKYHLYL